MRILSKFTDFLRDQGQCGRTHCALCPAPSSSPLLALLLSGQAPRARRRRPHIVLLLLLLQSCSDGSAADSEPDPPPPAAGQANETFLNNFIELIGMDRFTHAGPARFFGMGESAPVEFECRTALRHPVGHRNTFDLWETLY